jgi:hypothetical protein
MYSVSNERFALSFNTVFLPRKNSRLTVRYCTLTRDRASLIVQRSGPHLVLSAQNAVDQVALEEIVRHIEGRPW